MAWKYGDVDLTEYLLVEEIYAPAMAPMRNRYIMVEGMDGVHPMPAIRGMYYVEWRCRIMGDTRAASLNTRAELAAAMAAYREPVKLENDHDTLFEMAILDGESDARWDTTHLVFTLRFFCPYACKFGEEKTLELTSPYKITYAGTLETAPVMTLEGVTGPLSIKIGTGPTLSLTQTLSTAGTVEVDFDKRTVTANNGIVDLREYITLASRWGKLQTGNNDITVTGTHTKLTAKYTERYA